MASNWHIGNLFPGSLFRTFLPPPTNPPQEDVEVQGTVKRARQAVQKRKERDKTRALLQKLDTLLPEIPEPMMGARVDNSLGPSGRSLKQIIQDASVEIKKRKAGDFSTAVTSTGSTVEQPLSVTNSGLRNRKDFGLIVVILPLWEVRHASDGFVALFAGMPFDMVPGHKLVLSADCESSKRMLEWKPSVEGECVRVRLLVDSPHQHPEALARYIPIEFTVSMLQDNGPGEQTVALVCDLSAHAAHSAPSASDSDGLGDGTISGVYSFDFERSSHNPLLVAVGLKQHWAEFDDIIPFDKAKNDERVPNFILMPCFWIGKQVGRLILFKVKMQRSTLAQRFITCAVKGKMPYAMGGISSGWKDFCELALGSPVQDQLMDSPASWTVKSIEGEKNVTTIAILVREDPTSGKRRMIHHIVGVYHDDKICTYCPVPWNPAEDIVYVLKKQGECSPPLSRRGSAESCGMSAREEDQRKGRGFLTNPFFKEAVQ